MSERICYNDISVGLANLPNQVHRKKVLEGFKFNLIIAGDVGLGKSTFINMLFRSNIYKEVPYSDYQAPSTKPKIKTSTFDLVENGVKLRLTLIELSGILFDLEDSDKYKMLEEYVEKQNEKYLAYETSQKNDSTFEDSRVHACLYFLPSFLHHLRPNDINVMKKLDGKVNVIPVISKADSLTVDEAQSMKSRIRKDIIEHGIKCFPFEDFFDSCLQGNFEKKCSEELRENIPFSLVGSSNMQDIDGTRAYVRKYPWGLVRIDDPSHSDFKLFTDMFFKSHMNDLILFTDSCYYEAYRRRMLFKDAGISIDSGNNKLICPYAISSSIFSSDSMSEEQECTDAQNKTDFEKELASYERKLAKKNQHEIQKAQTSLQNLIAKHEKTLAEERASIDKLSVNYESPPGIANGSSTELGKYPKRNSMKKSR